MGDVYFSVNCLSCSSSAGPKNSSISWAVGMCLRVELCNLLLLSVGFAGLVVEPGVLASSVPLVKLQGVDSLVLL